MLFYLGLHDLYVVLSWFTQSVCCFILVYTICVLFYLGLHNLHNCSMKVYKWVCFHHVMACPKDMARGVFRPRQTRQLPRAVDLKGRLLSCQSY